MAEAQQSKTEIVVLAEKSFKDLPLNYVFSIVFGRTTRFVQTHEETLRTVCGVAAPYLVVLTAPKVNAQLCDLVHLIRTKARNCFILALTSHSAPEAVVQLFEAGCHEALRLPLSSQELAYRLRARSTEIRVPFDFTVDQVKLFDLGADIVGRAGMTDIEAQILALLIESDDKAVSRDDLSLAIDNQPWTYGNRKFDVHIASIRKKLESAFHGELSVRTIRNAGYQLSAARDLIGILNTEKASRAT